MRNLLLLSLSLSLGIAGCRASQPSGFPEGEPTPDVDEFDDDDAANDDDAVDDDDSGSPWTGLSPKGTIAGVVTDPSGTPIVDAVVEEWGSNPVNSSNTDAKGFFLLTPETWSPAQLSVWGDGQRLTSVALTEEVYLSIREPVVMPRWTEQGGATWLTDLTNFEWLEGVSVVIVQFTVDNPDNVVGLGATLGATNQGSFAIDAQGNGLATPNLPEGAQKPWLVFVGVEEGASTVQIQPNDGQECTGPSNIAAPPDAFTFVPVYCRSEDGTPAPPE